MGQLPWKLEGTNRARCCQNAPARPAWPDTIGVESSLLLARRIRLENARMAANQAAAQSARSVSAEKLGNTLTPNLRALSLALDVADVLLSMNVSARDVVIAATTITDSYCQRRAELDVNSNSLSISQDRGNDREPLTLIRRCTPRSVNNMSVQQVETLVREIDQGLSLEQAEQRIADIIATPRTYPGWLVKAGSAAIGTAVVLAYTTNPIILATTFVLCLVMERLVALLTHYQVPPFFCQIAASGFVVVSTSALQTWAAPHVEAYSAQGARQIAIGGIVMLVAGLTIVAAAQDAIDEFYLTAAARVFRVVMMTAGIVVGIVVGLLLVRQIGAAAVTIPINLLGAQPLPVQVLSALLVTGAFAVSTQCSRAAITWSCLIAFVGWSVTSHVGSGSASQVLAKGLAAAVVGFLAAIVARRYRSPSIAIATAGIIQFVPGMRLYQGLMQIVNNPPGTPHFETGLATLFTALSIALAIATGVSLGTIIGRPVHQRLAHATRLMRAVVNTSFSGPLQSGAPHVPRLAARRLPQALLRPNAAPSAHFEKEPQPGLQWETSHPTRSTQ